jgi:hypothetical protein
MPWAAMLLLFLAGHALAQEAESGAGDAPPESSAESGELLAITGADILTVTNGVVRQGTLLIQDGKILDVGQGLEIPADATVIDASGKVISPGFVGINVSGIGVRAAPGNNDKLEDALDPFDRNIKFALGAGITTSCVELSQARGRRRGRRGGEPEERYPGLQPPAREFVTEMQLDYGDEDTSLCPCCGLPILPTEPITEAPPSEEQPRNHAVLKMSFGDLSSMLVSENVFYSPAPGGLSGALNRHNWRRDVKQARQQVESQNVARENRGSRGRTAGAGGQPANSGRAAARRGTGARRGGQDNELSRLVKKEIRLRVEANTVDEIRDMIALAGELDYELVIEGGVEAWLVAAELGEAKVPVIYTPRRRRQPEPGRENQSGSSIESPGIFQQAGVPFATTALSSSISMGGIAGRDLSSLPLEAAFAVRGGATEGVALESLTIVPARLLGLEGRIGSIEKGKDADILILSGQPLDYRTWVETAIVNGRVCYQRQDDRVYPVED